MPTRDDLLRQIQKLISIVTDLSKEVSKFIRVDNDLIERYSRSMEELDSVRLSNEELRELIKDLIVESGRQADSVNRRLDRQEEFIILVGMGKSGSQKAGEITQEVSREHIDRSLQEELVEQQKLLMTYDRNIARVKQSIAEMGYETVENANKLDTYQSKIDKINESISRIREALR